jgi:hypothetical protein
MFSFKWKQRMSLSVASRPDAAATVAKAALRAGRLLGLGLADIGQVIGLSSASMTRLQRGEAALSGKSLELALLFVRLFRGLDAMTGGDDAASRSWLNGPNIALGGAVPAQTIRTIPGLVEAVAYVDARRAVL